MNRGCATCRWHRHLVTLDVHVCRCEEIIRQLDKLGVSYDMFLTETDLTNGCEYWEACDDSRR